MSPFLCVPSPTFPPVSRLPRSQTCRSLLPLSGTRFPPAQPAAPLPHRPSYPAGDPPAPIPTALHSPCPGRTRLAELVRRQGQPSRRPGEPSWAESRGLGRGAARRGRGRAAPGGAERCGAALAAAQLPPPLPAAAAPACLAARRSVSAGRSGRGKGKGEPAGPARGGVCGGRRARGGLLPRRRGCRGVSARRPRLEGRARPYRPGPCRADRPRHSGGWDRVPADGTQGAAGRCVGSNGGAVCAGLGAGGKGRREGGALPRCGAGSGGPPSPLPGAVLPGASPAVFRTGAKHGWCGVVLGAGADGPPSV